MAPDEGVTGSVQNITDSFNRANGGLGPNWITFPTFAPCQIVSDLAEPTSILIDCFEYYNAAPLGDQSSSIQVVNLANGGEVSVFVRSNTASQPSQYVFTVSGALGASAAIGILGYDTATTSVQLGSQVTLSLNSGDIIGISAAGSTITATVNGTAVIIVSDTNLASGHYGFGLSPTVAFTDTVVDDWQGQALTGLPLTAVSSNPQTGQYTVSPTGLYTFNAAQAGNAVTISTRQSFNTLQVVNSGATRSITVSLAAGTTYFFAVEAFGLDGPSGLSNIVSVSL